MQEGVCHLKGRQRGPRRPSPAEVRPGLPAPDRGTVCRSGRLVVVLGVEPSGGVRTGSTCVY